jgi:hypothetical protein
MTVEVVARNSALEEKSNVNEGEAKRTKRSNGRSVQESSNAGNST